MAKLLPVLVVFALLTALFFLTVFKVKNISIKTNQKCVPGQNLIVQLNLVDKNTFLVSEEQIKKELTDKYACIDQIFIKKSYPSKIIIDITIKKPIVTIEGTNLSLTESGQIVENDKPNLPVIFLLQDAKPQLGQVVTDQAVIFALKLTSILHKSDYIATNIRLISVTDVAVYNKEGTVALFSTKKEPGQQVDSLQQVLIASKINSSKIEKIDLRYDKPIAN